MRLRLLDLDGSLTLQPSLRRTVERVQGQVVDLRAEGPGLRLWASRAQMHAFSELLARLPPVAGEGVEVTFLGSGDFHHLSAALIAARAEALTLVHFDNHPDWVRLPPAYHCGSWVNRVLDLPHVVRVLTIGPCSDDLDRPQTKGGNLSALGHGKLELYPWRHAPSRIWGRIGSGPGRRREGGYLVWRNLADEDIDGFFTELMARVPTDAVWITIDKDVLAPEAALTNWDQGEMPLAVLLKGIAHVAAKKRLLGIDICGEYAPPQFDSLLKRMAAWLDHPHEAAPAPAAVERNDRTNAALLEVIEAVAA